MDLLRPDPEVVFFGLRAMKMVASADGSFSGRERDLLATAQRAFGTDVDVDALEPIEPEDLARRLPDPRLRRQIVRGMVVLSLVDGKASEAEAAIVDRFARAGGGEQRSRRAPQAGGRAPVAGALRHRPAVLGT